MIHWLQQVADTWAAWMWPMFWQSALLIGVAAGVDVLLRRRAHPQIRMAVWLVVILKLMLPPSLPSPVSVTAPLFERPDFSWMARSGAVAQDAPAPASATLSEKALPTATSPRIARLSVSGIALLVWLGGVLLCGAAACRRYRRLRRALLLGPQVHPPSENIGRAARRAALRLGLPRIPEIRCTTRIPVPAVCGIFKPVVLLPVGAERRWSTRELEHILLHELAHIKRRDLPVHGVVVAVQVLYWCFPPVWFAARRIRMLRELCCDATVAEALRESTPEYRRTLLYIARQLLHRAPHSGLGFLGLQVEHSNIIARLSWLERDAWIHRRRRRAGALLLGAVLLICVAPMVRATPQPQPSMEPAEAFRVLDMLAGSWQTVSQYQFEPGGPLVNSSGRCQTRWVLDDRFLLQEVEGQGMLGRTFKGLGFVGFDGARQCFTAVWIDNMGTAVNTSRGQWDPAARTLEFHGRYIDPSDGRSKTYRSQLRLVDPDTYVEEMYEVLDDHTTHRFLEVTYQRS